jgi:hypothetical protein
MTGKIKVALCLSGEARSSMAAFPYIYETFLQQNDLYKTDVFVHSRNYYRSLDLFNPKSILIDESDDKAFVKQFINSQIISSKLEERMKVNKIYSFNSSSYKNQILMWDGINKSLGLAFNNEVKYDIYIRCRPDIIFRNRFFIDQILIDIINKKYDLFIPYSSPNSYSLIKDQIAIGNYKSLYQYFNISPNLFSLYDQHQTLLPEQLLENIIKDNNIKINGFYIHEDLLRSVIIRTDKQYPNYNE